MALYNHLRNRTGIASLTGLAGLALLTLTLSGCPEPVSKPVYEDGVVPIDQVRLTTEDYNNNKKLETVLTVEGQKYLIKKDSNGKLKFVPFVVEPVKIRELEEEKNTDIKPGYAEKPADGYPPKK